MFGFMSDSLIRAEEANDAVLIESQCEPIAMLRANPPDHKRLLDAFRDHSGPQG